ncbi:hypothetical protein [Pseudonocardia endophytica]|uniref:Uncharacterized protein n=1 Tax=Pseudonocardia endophytica TaxID=401976 RepID=A0A4R1I499_PSEEN|nr:hypothetical protein [Pseudonocardia endophytica]TCK27379.1 hypothetical protein EV378_3250 [Pseudonocardia endophytica]
MDIQNHYYGHSAVLAAYAGLSRPRHVAGLLQHGWTATSPVAAHFADFPSVGSSPRRRLLVWSHRSRAWSPGNSGDGRPTTAVGAPILYLERLLHAQGWTRSDSLGPVFVPFHGTRLVRVTGAHADLARQVAKVDGPSTVCLHHEDMTDPEITSAWADAGHRLVTAGRRDDPHFLLRIMHLAGNASRLSSNRLSTAVVYAAALGTPAAVWGDPLTFGNQGDDALAMLRSTWPEFHTADPDDGTRPSSGAAAQDAAATMLARAELGADALLEPGPLRAALGWSHRTPGPLVQYYAASPLAKAAMVLGLTKRSEASTAAMSAGGFSPWLWLRHPLAALPRPLPPGLDTPVTTLEPPSAA